MTLDPCGCHETPGRVFVWCPLHKAAPELLSAAKLAALNFKRSNISDENFLGDDDHEAWVALNKAIALATRKVK